MVKYFYILASTLSVTYGVSAYAFGPVICDGFCLSTCQATHAVDSTFEESLGSLEENCPHKAGDGSMIVNVTCDDGETLFNVSPDVIAKSCPSDK